MNLLYKTLLAASALFAFTGCEPKTNPNPEDPNTTPSNKFELTVYASSLSQTSLEIVSTGESQRNFVSGTVSKDIYTNTLGANDERLAYYILKEIEEKDADINSVDGIYVLSGAENTINLYDAWGITYDTEYVSCAFEVEEDGNIAEGITTTQFTSKSEGISSYDTSGVTENFTTTLVSIKQTDVFVKVNPNEDIDNYITAILAKDQIDNECKGKLEDVAYLILQAYINAGVSFDNADNHVIFSGEQTVEVSKNWDVFPGEDYIVLTFGVSKLGTVTSEVNALQVSTDGGLASSDPNGDLIITVTGTTTETMYASINAKNYKGLYFTLPISKYDMDRGFLNEDGTYNFDAAAKNFLDVEAYYYKTDMTTPNGMSIFSGDANVDYSEAWGFSEPDIEFYLIAFGYDPRTLSITTKVANVFTSNSNDGSGDPEVEDGVKFDFSIYNVGMDNLKVKYQPSEKDVPYFFAYYNSVIFNNPDYADDQQGMMIEMLNRAGAHLSNWVASDTTEVNAVKLDPGTEYVAVAFGFDGSKITTELYYELITTETSSPEIPTEITFPDVDFGTSVTQHQISDNYETLYLPKADNSPYIYGVMLYDEYKAMSSDTEVVFRDFDRFNAALEKYEDERYSFNVMVNAASNIGNYTKIFRDLAYGTKYVAYAYGFDNRTLQPTTKLHIEEFTTEGNATQNAPRYDFLDAIYNYSSDRTLGFSNPEMNCKNLSTFSSRKKVAPIAPQKKLSL